MRYTKTIALIALLGSFAIGSMAAAQQQPGRPLIVVTEGLDNPVPIAVSDLFSAKGDEAEIGRNISQVIGADLERSGIFKPLDKNSFIQSPQAVNAQPRIGDWKQIGAALMVHGTIAARANGDIRVEFRLWDVGTGQQLTGQALETRPQNWRRLAHKVADAIYKRTTGENGYFDSRVVYVAETGPKTARVKRLALMDQDGANQRYLTDGSALVLTPRFSPSSQEITYLSYVGNRPRVHVMNIDTGRQEVVGDFPGMTFAPRFSPDGNRIIMSLETNGNSDIYVMDLRTRQTQRLTDHPSIDTSPSFSPDARRIVFNSDRAGQQKIYVMNADGSAVTRITNEAGRYATPVWSPRDDFIAFTKIAGSSFYVGVIRPDGTGERLLAEGFLVEGPTWSPNGRVLMFYRQDRGGPAQLYTVDLTGKNERRLGAPTEASDPAWSPLLRD
ncbi:MAG: Tol-Pal system beta propeller repeat protein TolB [Alphaproteobacteria bacterium]